MEPICHRPTAASAAAQDNVYRTHISRMASESFKCMRFGIASTTLNPIMHKRIFHNKHKQVSEYNLVYLLGSFCVLVTRIEITK